MKTICIYRNEAFEQKTQSEVEKAQAFAQELVNTFNGLGFDPLQESEFQTLLMNPRAVYDSRIAKVKTPKGVNREKYLPLLDLPSVEPLLTLQKRLIATMYGSNFELFSLIGNVVSYDQKQVERLKNSQSVIVEENSLEHQSAIKFFGFIEVLNNIKECLSPSISNPLKKVVDFREKTPGDYRAVVNRQKLLEYISTVKNTQKHLSHAEAI